MAAGQIREQGLRLQSTLYAGLSVSHSATAAAVCGLWRQITVG